jgi:predicted metal-dependent phosphoesterase TrpH
MVQRLNDLGVRIEFASVLEQAAGGAIGRPHVARAMIAEGWAVDFRDAFDRYLGNGRPAYVTKERLPVTDAVMLIHRSGGLAILAHPSHSGTRERIAAFVEQGMDGVEVRHPSHSSEDISRLAALVQHFSLVPSGGSDWHGSADGPRTLGMMRVPADWLGQQDSRVRARAA